MHIVNALRNLEPKEASLLGLILLLTVIACMALRRLYLFRKRAWELAEQVSERADGILTPEQILKGVIEWHIECRFEGSEGGIHAALETMLTMDETALRRMLRRTADKLAEQDPDRLP